MIYCCYYTAEKSFVNPPFGKKQENFSMENMMRRVYIVKLQRMIFPRGFLNDTGDELENPLKDAIITVGRPL